MAKYDVPMVRMFSLIVLLAGIGVAVGFMRSQNGILRNSNSENIEKINGKTLFYKYFRKFFIPVTIKFLDTVENEVEDQDDDAQEMVDPTNDCLLQNGSRVANGVSYQEFCDTLTCVNGEITGRVVPTYSTECPADFDLEDDLGCVKLIESPTELWCDARRMCFEMGADLVSLSADEGIENLTPLTDYVRTDKSFNGQVWVGLWRTNSDLWDWTIGGGQVTSDSDIFTSSDPNGPGQFQCNRLANNNKLGDRFCDSDVGDDGGNFAYVCEVPGFD